MPKEINIDKIRTDGGTQPRSELDEGVIEKYAEQMKNGDQFPALLVYNDGENYWLTDGFHRFHANKQIGTKQVICYIQQGTRRDAVLASTGVNSKHGLNRTNTDKRRSVIKLLEDKEWSKWGNAEIARQCNVGKPLVIELRKSHPKEITGDDQERTYIDKHGNENTMDISKMGANKQPQPTTDKESEPKDTDPEQEEGEHQTTTNNKFPELKDNYNQKSENNDDFIPKTSKLVTQALDKVQYILQGDIESRNKADIDALNEIRVNFIRAIRLAGQMGIDVSLVWEKRGKLDDKFELGILKEDEINKSNTENNIIDINPRNKEE